MRKLAVSIAAISMIIAACGDSGGSSGGFSDCDELAQGGIELLQDVLDEVSDMSLEEFAAAADTGDDPEFLTKFQGRADALEAGQADLECSDSELQSYILDNLDQLEATGTVGELLLEAIKADPEGFFD